LGPSREALQTGGNTMKDPFESAFSAHMQPVDNGEDKRTQALRVAACVLLLELAWADDEFSPAERAHIEAVLRRHFALDEIAAQSIIQLAEGAREQDQGIQRFAGLIRDNYDLSQKLLLAEIMWGLILADGAIARHEAHLLRRIAGLLDLETGYLAQARNAARSTLH
jgi:uncharacterized tellurite resistance protein B-like protein